MKTKFIPIILFFLNSLAYAHVDCPEANLSEEQEAQIKELRQEVKASAEDLSREEKRAAWKDLRTRILERVVEGEQREALAKCFENRKKKHKRRKHHRKYCPEAELSKEQRKQIKKLHKEFRVDACDFNEEERKAAREDLHNHILERVAEENQKEALLKCFERGKERRHQRNHCPEANLSEEQKEHIKALRQEFRAKTCDLSREEKGAAREDLHNHILEKVAEEDQREALSKCFERRKKRHKKKH